jgi:alkylation response protein AidB-like acyl-CoA dehydrogenase
VDLRPTPEEGAFREHVRGWLEANIPEEWKAIRGRVRGLTLLADEMGEDAARDFAKGWHRKLYEAGFIGLSWPKRYGGRELGPVMQFIWQEEYARAKPPPQINVIGTGWAGPAILLHGTEEQKQRFLPKILSGDEIWCQLFSEPGAGSDLAGLSTKAVATGDEFVLNGQKVWTSIAREAGWGICIARTDPEVPKHAGVSFLLVDMSDPGIEIRPIQQMNGSGEFNEVFLTDVRVPRSNLVGELNGGWTVTITTLMHERIGLSLGGGSLWGQGPGIDDLVELMVKQGAVIDPVLRDRLGHLYVEAVAHRMLKLRLVSKAERGEVGAEASIQKLFGDVWGQKLNALALQSLGPGGNVWDPEDSVDGGVWQSSFLFSPALTIGGGTTEVQKNIIGERILGLPKEPSTR